GRPGRGEAIDSTHPAKAVRLVGLLSKVQAVVPLAPGISIAGHAVAGLRARLGVIGVALAPEGALDVLLAAEPSAPRGIAAGAIVEHAEDAPSARIGLGLQSPMAGGGTRDLHRRAGVDPA